MAAGRMHDVRCDRILPSGQHTGQPAGEDDPGESCDRTLSHGNVVDYIPIYPMYGAQIYPDSEPATGKEKECIGTAIHICTQKITNLIMTDSKGKIK